MALNEVVARDALGWMLDWSDAAFWLAFGLLGNATFASRFLVQWLASECSGENTIPRVFWYPSIMGSLVFLVHAIYLENIVLPFAHPPRMTTYLRDLALIRGRTSQPVLGPLRDEGHAPGTAPGV